MARTAYKFLLCSTITSVHGANARWLTVTPVQEVVKGKIVWEGTVDTFELLKHPQAKFCYAWSLEVDDIIVVLTALKIAPVVSAHSAIHIAYHEGKLDPKRHLLIK
jgi:hypothetical protein